jgi:hypothetical protein
MQDHYQTRVESFIEALVNVVIGFGINFVANMAILPQLGFTSLTWKTNLLIGLFFTLISVARSYAIRRWAQQHLRRFVKSVSTTIINLYRKVIA